MALREIGATLKLDGEKEFRKGMNDAARGLRVLDSELKASSAAFAGNERSLESLTAKGQLFERKVAQQKKVIEALARAVKESGEMYGEASEKTDGYRIKLNNATAALAKMERELEQNSQAMSELGQDTDHAASKMDKLKNKAQAMKESLKKTGEGIGNAGQTMSVGVTAPIIAGIALATEGTRDFRGDLARLKTNAKAANQDIGVLDKGMAQMYAVTGEVDSNVEGFSNILATGFRDDSILKIMEGLAGAAIKWSDTLKFEGLADGLQETLATGKSIGPFDEMLSRAGVDLDKWNQGLAEAISKGTQQQYVLDTLANLGLPAVLEEYKKTNKELYESAEAHYEMQAAMADMGTKLDPIVTKVVKTVTKIIDKFNEMPASTQDFIINFGLIVAAIGPVLAAIGKGMVFFALFGDKLGWVTKIGGTLAGFLPRLGAALLGINPIVAGVVLAVAGLIAIFKRLWDTSPAFRNWVRGLADSLQNGLKGAINSVVDQLNWLIEKINKLPGIEINTVGKMTKSSGTTGWADFRKLDGNAEGTRNWKGGWTMVGEKGAELAWLPQGTDIRSHGETTRMMNQSLTIGGLVRIEGVNNMNEVVGVAELVAKQIEQGDRRLAGRVRVMPSMA